MVAPVQEIVLYVQERTNSIEQLETASNLAWWNLAVTGEDRYAKDLESNKVALRKLYSSSSDCEFLKMQKDQDEPLLRRQIELLLQSYKENQISPEMIETISALETEIEALYTNFRPVVDGKTLSNNDLKEILTNSIDSAERRKAWEASKEIGQQVEEKVRQLIALRNESAREAGFSDYYSMRLELQELDQDRLFTLLDKLEHLTDPYWRKYKAELDRGLAAQYGLQPDELMPWHYQDPFFQEAPKQEIDLDSLYASLDLVEISRKFFNDIQMPVEDILERSDLYEREKKNQHAFCTCIDRQQDVRVLCNMRSNEYWMGTLLHELGHAVYDKYIDASLPFLLRTPAHTNSTEASAMLFGRLSKDQYFLQHYAGVAASEAQRLGRAAAKQNAAHLLVFARWTLVMVHFERAMYQNPDTDLNKLWWDYVEKFQGLKHVSDRNLPDWAAKLHLACAPVYYQNYILGEMTASQLFHYLQNLEKGKSFCQNSQIGDFLKSSFYAPGASRPWEETLEYATQEKLNPEYFAEDIKVSVY